VLDHCADLQHGGGLDRVGTPAKRVVRVLREADREGVYLFLGAATEGREAGEAVVVREEVAEREPGGLDRLDEVRDLLARDLLDDLEAALRALVDLQVCAIG
jgi:hypothetical protein